MKKSNENFFNNWLGGYLNKILLYKNSFVCQTHLLVLKYQLETKDKTAGTKVDGTTSKERRSSLLSKIMSELKIEEIFENNEKDIDEITEIDEWKITKSASLKLLHEGWHCFVAKKENKIVATGWATQGESFFDTYLKREFFLGAEESYFWRGQCVPAFRGKGIAPCLGIWMTKNLEITQNKSTFYTLVRHDNNRIIKTMGKIGWNKIGRAGFVDIFSFRIHYLLGKDAFPHIEKRLFVQRKW